MIVREFDERMIIRSLGLKNSHASAMPPRMISVSANPLVSQMLLVTFAYWSSNQIMKRVESY